ncbi:hypothetical protein BUALT_Bualt04G0015200 [Buddleja alternifolia]|uniref:CCHC-type domain-containing protein n=1 Tax=Buddleja alternifolia TaxID=168488 RepID=A0AAV6XS13_9LAMI|nr:hypothetical protein BUALT_Bualt04G0015200 [Buddleja alternifolia]
MLLKHLRIEEETRIRDKTQNVHSSARVNYVSDNNNGGKKRKSFGASTNRFKNVTCYYCGKKGHIKKDCCNRKRQKIEKKPKTIQVAEAKIDDIIAMVSAWHISAELEVWLVTTAIEGQFSVSAPIAVGHPDDGIETSTTQNATGFILEDSRGSFCIKS